MKRILIMAAALSLLAAPAALAERGQGHGGGGHHAGAARHAGGGGRHMGAQRAHAGPRQAARSRATPRRAHSGRSATRARAGRSYARHANTGRAAVRNRAANRHVAGRFHGADRNHWRHASRIGRWGRGGRLPASYWRGRPWIDWRVHHLWAPPYGYQWVYVDGDYVLLAIASGLIADIVIGGSYY